MQIVYIYVLIDPRTDEVRYVGKSNDPKVRYRNHANHTKNKKSHKEMWVKQLQSLGMKPVLFVVEETDEDHWRERERWWQLHFEELGANLTNLNDCGYGRPGFAKTPEQLAILRALVADLRNREDVREKYRQYMKDRWKNDAEYVAKMKTVHLGAKRSEETKKKLSEGLKRAHEQRRIEACGKIKLNRSTPEIIGLIDPDGNPVPPFVKIRDFCEPRGLSECHLNSVIHGKRRIHRGYTFRNPEETQ